MRIENADQWIAPKPAIVEQMQSVVPSNYEEFVIIGQLYRQTKDQMQWELGRLAYELTKPFIDREEAHGMKLMESYAKDIGVDRKTLERYRRVYRIYKIENEFVETHLSFSHYDHSAKMEKPTEWIVKAADNNWTISQLDFELARATGKELPHSTVTCPHCHQSFTVGEKDE